MKKQLFLLLCGLFALSVQAQQVIPLYEGKAPGSENWTWQEGVSTNNMFGTPTVYNVVNPSITAYLPNPALANGTAVIVAPGGAFHTLSIESEGTEVAKWLNAHGIAAFVLKYRVARSFTDDPVKEIMGKMRNMKQLDAENDAVIPLATQDGLKAVTYVRTHAKELNIDPQKIGFMGFSAGGTLTMSVVYTATDENRPNFVAPIYAYEKAILGNVVPKVKTPIFIAAASDDQLGFAPHSHHIYQKWLDAKQPAELHIYQQGGHGFGMHRNHIPTDTWIERFGDWLRLNGLMNSPVEMPLTFVAELKVKLNPAMVVGDTPKGLRRIIPIVGGSVEGPALKGTIIESGADWQIVRSDGVAELEAHYQFKTDDGVLIYVKNTGLRVASPEVAAKIAKGEAVDASQYYFRAVPKFEAPKGKYEWMNNAIFICKGIRNPDSVVIQVWKVE